MGVALIVALGLVSAAAAQQIRCDPNKGCSSGVQFLPTQAQYVAAIGGTLAPTTPANSLQIKLKSDKKNAYGLEVSRSPWAPDTSLKLEMRTTVSGPHMPPTTSNWAPVSTVPAAIFTQVTDPRDASVNFRLRVDGSEPPGTYITTVTFHTWSDTSAQRSKNNAQDTVAVTVKVIVPAYLSLIVDGVPAGQTASVAFDYTLSNLVTYFQALQTGALLRVTSATFKRLAVATNNPTGYRVDVSVVQNSGPPASTLGVADIQLLKGAQLNGYVFSSSRPTVGYVTLLVPSDVGLRVDGGAVAGPYRFTATYIAQTYP